MGKSVSDGDMGLMLARAAMTWRSRMRREMTERGFPWHAEARGDVLPHLGPDGASQASLATRMGFSKQAVQQLIDQLVDDGVVQRLADPADKRARRIVLTELGLRDLDERGRVRRAIEADYRLKLGDKRYKRLEKTLRKLAAD